MGELGDYDDHVDYEGEGSADPVDDQTSPPVGFLEAQVVAGHPRLGEGERREDPDGIEGNESFDFRPREQQQDDGEAGEEEDPVGEHQPVAPGGQPPWHEVVAGVKGRQPGEVGEACVGRQDEDHRSPLERIEERLADHTVPVDEVTDPER